MFTLEIKMGNDAMQTAADLSFALAYTGQQLERGWFEPDLPGSGSIRDANGNTVGKWEYVPAN